MAKTNGKSRTKKPTKSVANNEARPDSPTEAEQLHRAIEKLPPAFELLRDDVVLKDDATISPTDAYYQGFTPASKAIVISPDDFKIEDETRKEERFDCAAFFRDAKGAKALNDANHTVPISFLLDDVVSRLRSLGKESTAKHVLRLRENLESNLRPLDYGEIHQSNFGEIIRSDDGKILQGEENMSELRAISKGSYKKFAAAYINPLLDFLNAQLPAVEKEENPVRITKSDAARIYCKDRNRAGDSELRNARSTVSKAIEKRQLNPCPDGSLIKSDVQAWSLACKEKKTTLKAVLENENETWLNVDTD